MRPRGAAAPCSPCSAPGTRQAAQHPSLPSPSSCRRSQPVALARWLLPRALPERKERSWRRPGILSEKARGACPSRARHGAASPGDGRLEGALDTVPTAAPTTTASIPTPTPCPKSEEEPRRAGAEASRVSPGGVSGPEGWGLIAGTVSVCEAAPCRGRLWFSTRPQRQDGSRGALGASFLGALQRRQPKVRAGSGPWLGE